METRDHSFGRGVSLSGAVCLREGQARTTFINEGSSVSAADLFDGNEGDLMWRTAVPAFTSGVLAEMLLCSFNKQKPLHAVVLDATVFWTVTLRPMPLSSPQKISSLVRSVEGVRDLQSGLECINGSLCGIGKIERSPYVVVEDPSLVGVYDFFRRNNCDVDWVKRQVYGERLVHVPETFPRDVATPEEIRQKLLPGQARQAKPGRA